MDGYSGKRGGPGIIAPKKGYNVGFKNPSSDRDHSAQFCNRIGCNGRIKYTSTQNTKIGSSEKTKLSKPSFSSSSSNGNEKIGDSSRSNGSVMTSAKSLHLDSKRKMSSRLESDRPESSQSGDSGTRELVSSLSRNLTRDRLGSKNKTEEVKNGISSAPSNIRSRKVFQNASFVASNSKNSGLRTLNSSSSSSGNNSSNNNNNNNNNNKFSVRNSKCNSISDVVQPSGSSSESKSKLKSVGKNAIKKKSPEGVSSFCSRGHNGHLTASTSSVSISGSGHSDFATGDSKGAGSVKTRKPVNVNDTRTRLSYERNSSSQFPDSEIPVNIGGPQFSASGSSSSSSSYSLSSITENHSAMMRFTAAELGFTHLMNSESYNMDGITEVLLAIERIEQDGELTHEQVLALETNLFLNGLNLYDQHRDMRLDIDNMSYEELLALEERMGTVSTALSEEALLKCIKRSIYEAAPPEVRVTGSGEDGDDINCSICQEEYVIGDETGKLVKCQHGFHLTCINQWLRLKNWCPICKAAAAPPQES